MAEVLQKKRLGNIFRKVWIAQKSLSNKHVYKRDVEVNGEQVLCRHVETRVNKHAENTRLQDFRRKQYAAMRIQKAWRNHKLRSFAILLTAKQEVRKMRLRRGAEESQREMAALIIQLAWRKYIRRKLQKSLTSNKQQLKIWDPEVMALKQRTLVGQIYGEHIEAPFWHPFMLPQERPFGARLAPSSAAVSFNFAIDHYHRLLAKQSSIPSPLLAGKSHPKKSCENMVDENDLQGCYI